jgi:C-terminal processing protease CtpA/Prc
VAWVRAAEQLASLGFGTLLSMLAIVALDDATGIWAILGLLSAGVLLPLLAAYTFPGWIGWTRRTMGLGILVPVCLMLPVSDALVYPTPLDVGGGWGILALAVAFAALCHEMVHLGLLARDEAERHPWVGRAMPVLALLPFVALWGIAAEQRKARHDSRMEMAAQLVTRLWEHYPHWREAPVTPWELWSKYRPVLEAADRRCPDPDRPCPEYLRSLRAMFSELRNGHTEILLDGELGMPAIRVEPVEGRAVVTQVQSGSDAEAAGIVAGTEIVAVNGVSVDEALRGVPPWRRAFASPRMRSYAGYAALLDGPAGSSVGVTIRGEATPPRQVTLRREPFEYADDSPEEHPAEEPAPASLPGGLTSGFGYARLDGFEDAGASRRFDAFLDASMAAPGLVLDLRGNYGGLLEHAFHVLSRLVPEPLVLGQHCAPGGIGGAPCTEHRIEPRPPVYEGPVAVLIDEDVYSAAEIVAHALCRSGRARCFGRPTAGETDCVFRLDIPGAVARVSWAGFSPAFGPALQGEGVFPDETVERTLEEVRTGSDLALEAASRWLRLAPPPRRPARESSVDPGFQAAAIDVLPGRPLP